MNAPFVTSLRTRGEALTLGETAVGEVLHLRVEVAEMWDAVRVDAQATETVRAVKVHALTAMVPDALFPDDFVVKLAGHEIFDEGLPLTQAGVVDGSILLVTRRRRRPVR